MAYPTIQASFVAFAAWALASPHAHAGAFAVREQSAAGAGMAHAGEGTSSMGLSGMFWNPAAVTRTRGLETESHITGVMPRSVVETLPGTSPALLALGSPSVDIGKNAILGSMYTGYQYNENVFFGFVSATPFGFSSAAPVPWPGQNVALNATAKTFEGNPIVGYKFNDTVSVGVGLRVMWAKAEFSRALVPLALAPNVAALEGTDIGVGWNAGITFRPWEGTELALGYRSRIRLTLDGDTGLPPAAPLVGQYGITGTITTPDQLHFGVAQRITGSFTLLGTVEWQNWSLFQTLPFTFKNGPAAGAVATTLQFHYRDSWYFAGGGEYRLSPQTILRAGIGYEKSPITDAARATALPSTDGWRFSAGMTHNVTPAITFDIGVSYYVEKDAPIRIVPGHPDSGALLFPPPIGQLSYVGAGHIDLWGATVGLRYRFGADGAVVRR